LKGALASFLEKNIHRNMELWKKVDAEESDDCGGTRRQNKTKQEADDVRDAAAGVQQKFAVPEAVNETEKWKPK
jgi:hypothetical protein